MKNKWTSIFALSLVLCASGCGQAVSHGSSASHISSNSNPNNNTDSGGSGDNPTFDIMGDYIYHSSELTLRVSISAAEDPGPPTVLGGSASAYSGSDSSKTEIQHRVLTIAAQPAVATLRSCLAKVTLEDSYTSFEPTYSAGNIKLDGSAAVPLDCAATNAGWALLSRAIQHFSSSGTFRSYADKLELTGDAADPSAVITLTRINPPTPQPPCSVRGGTSLCE